MGKLPHAVCTGNQYTHAEWTSSNLDHFQNAEASRHVAERIRAEASILITERNAKTVLTQNDVNSKLGDRVRDIRQWKDDLARETEKLEEEAEHLQEAGRHLEYAISQSKRPLKVCQECLAERENRVGIDQVKDAVEKNLKKEVENIHKYQHRMKTLREKVSRQLDELAARKSRLQNDVSLKDEAFTIDQKCFSLHNESGDVNFHCGIERVEQSASVPLSWQEYSQANLRNSAFARDVSEQIRSDVDTLISDAAKDMLICWTNTNKEFQERISETQEIQGKLTSHIHLVERDILAMDTLIDQLKTAKAAKQAPMKVSNYSSCPTENSPSGK